MGPPKPAPEPPESATTSPDEGRRLLLAGAAAIDANVAYHYRLSWVFYLVYALQVPPGFLMLFGLRGAEYEALTHICLWTTTALGSIPLALPPSNSWSVHRPREVYALLSEEPGACAAVEAQRVRHVKSTWFRFPLVASLVAVLAALLFDETRVTGPLWIKVYCVASACAILVMQLYSLLPTISTPELASVSQRTTLELMRAALSALLERIEQTDEPYDTILSSVLRMKRLVELTTPHVFIRLVFDLLYPLSSFPAWVGIAVHPEPSGVLVWYMVFSGLVPLFTRMVPHAIQMDLDALPGALAYRALLEEQRGRPEQFAKFKGYAACVAQCDLGWVIHNVKVTGTATAYVRATILPVIVAAAIDAGTGTTVANWFWSEADLGLVP